MDIICESLRYSIEIDEEAFKRLNKEEMEGDGPYLSEQLEELDGVFGVDYNPRRNNKVYYSLKIDKASEEIHGKILEIVGKAFNI
jgi:hypothetical protein